MATKAKMTRAHFKLIAAVVKESLLRGPAKYLLACQFANALAATNPSFKREKFIEACSND
jgi:hypothetical protein